MNCRLQGHIRTLQLSGWILVNSTIRLELLDQFQRLKNKEVSVLRTKITAYLSCWMFSGLLQQRDQWSSPSSSSSSSLSFSSHNAAQSWNISKMLAKWNVSITCHHVNTFKRFGREYMINACLWFCSLLLVFLVERKPETLRGRDMNTLSTVQEAGTAWSPWLQKKNLFLSALIASSLFWYANFSTSAGCKNISAFLKQKCKINQAYVHMWESDALFLSPETKWRNGMGFPNISPPLLPLLLSFHPFLTPSRSLSLTLFHKFH